MKKIKIEKYFFKDQDLSLILSNENLDNNKDIIEGSYKIQIIDVWNEERGKVILNHQELETIILALQRIKESVDN